MKKTTLGKIAHQDVRVKKEKPLAKDASVRMFQMSSLK
jgi:hypothetical protein